MSIPRVGGIPQTMLEQLREAVARIVELEAENEDLKGANLPLYSDRIKNLESRIAELEAELREWRDYFGCESPHDVYLVNSSTDHMIAGKEQERANRLAAENALLLKALSDAPTPMAYLGNIAFFNAYDKWWGSRRAALARIQEVKP